MIGGFVIGDSEKPKRAASCFAESRITNSRITDHGSKKKRGSPDPRSRGGEGEGLTNLFTSTAGSQERFHVQMTAFPNHQSPITNPGS